MTGFFVLLVIIFAIMTAFPFLLALRIPKEKQGTLVVQSDNKRDPRYFVQSFQKIVKSALETRTEEKVLQLSKPEPFVYAEEVKGKAADKLVICKDDFVTEEAFVCEREIYSEHVVTLAAETKARAVAAKRLYLEENSTVFRWSDGKEAMYAERGCNLGVSATSAVYLQVMENCSFRRLYAPQVDILTKKGEEQPERRTLIQEEGLDADFESMPVEKNVKVIEKNRVIKGNVITKYPLVIEEGVKIFGHVKSRKGISVQKNVRIDGNLFADGTIILREQICLTGDVFSQQDIYVGPDCVIGQKGKIKSVVAKENIVLCEAVTVYGYIGCDGCGITLNQENFLQKISDL